MTPNLRRLCGLAFMAVAAVQATACMMDNERTKRLAEALQGNGPKPDEAPVLVNKELPFRYPVLMYARKVQGNVTLRLFIDKDGRVHPESTQVRQSSGYPALDSAAVTGSAELHFVPAKLRGEPMSVTVLFPVYYRHPDAKALPGDTILKHDK